MSRNTLRAKVVAGGHLRSTGRPRRPDDRMPFSPSVQAVARGISVLVLLAVVALLLFYVVGGRFGTINDWLNAAIGVVSALLAILIAAAVGGAPGAGARTDPAHAVDLAAAIVAVAGGAVMVYGSYLIISGETGWFRAGVVSAVGAALLGVWLLVLNRPFPAPPESFVGLSRLGRLAGAVMSLGLLAIPGWVSGVDDWAAAPWYVQVGMFGWIGTYVVYPAWCFHVSRAR